MFSLRKETWIYEKIRIMPHMFPRSGESRVDSGRYQEQLVESVKLKAKNVKLEYAFLLYALHFKL